jgi:hypothetical protein
MADPFSVIAGIAGVACAGTQLSVALYEVYNRLINAPKEIAEIASELANLGSIFEHLRATLEVNKKLLKKKLMITVEETLSRFRALQEDVKETMLNAKKFERLRWLFRRERVAALMAKVGAVRSNLNMLLSIVQIAITNHRREKK